MGGLRILVPLDDSLQAHRVLVYARALAGPPDGKLKLIRATDIEDENSFNSLTQNALRLRESGLEVQSRVLGGVDAISAIQSEVQNWHPDLIALASDKSSGLDRWLNGSVTKDVVRLASVPVLVVPPNWEQPFGQNRPARILVPLDGSEPGEEAVGIAIRLASMMPALVILMRAVDREEAPKAVAAYVNEVRVRVQPLIADGGVISRVVVDSPAGAILNTAQEMHVDAIVMAGRPHAGSTGVAVFENASVPLVVVPTALAEARSAQVKFGIHVRGFDQKLVGEVHRIVVDLEQRAASALVVLTRGGLGRDVLVPLDFIESIDDHEVQLRLTRQEVDDLPDYTYNQLITAPSTWTSFIPPVDGPDSLPAKRRKRLAATQTEFTRQTKLLAQDGEVVGHLDGAEIDLERGQLKALRVREDGTFGHELRIPIYRVQHGLNDDTLRIDATRADITAYVG